MKKKFVTIFPICENVHLVKDLGQIPYFLYKNHGYDASIVTYKNSESYHHLQGEVNGLKIEFIENSGSFSFLEKGVINYIRKNAKQIDVLNLFHFSKQSFAYGLLYKLLNPDGFLYLKIDGYNETFAEGSKLKHSQKKVKSFFLKQLERMCLERTDLLTIENTEGERLVKLMYPQYASKVAYFPVGVNDLFLQEHFSGELKNFSQKENIILTTGRIGLEIKNHEMIIRSLLNVNLKDWKMVFVGPVNPAFKTFFEQMSAQHPQLKERVSFTGAIDDRVELYEWYNRSKIFLMTSWKESFSLSIAEAIYFGNYVIGTEGVMSMKDVTDNEKYGTILKADDDKALSLTLQRCIDNENEMKKIYTGIMERSRNNFVWSRIIAGLNEKIKSKIG